MCAAVTRAALATPDADAAPADLQVGADAVAVRAHADQLLKDLAAWEPVAADTRIDPVAA